MKKVLSIALKIIIVISSIMGIILSSILKENDYMGGITALLYFTIQSNMWICLVCLFYLVIELIGFINKKDYYRRWMYIVKYIFTNNSKESTSFSYSVSDTAYQNGIELDEAYFVSGSANYSSENQSVKIQPGITLEVEVAYELTDENSDVFIELSKYGGRKITKTFTIN